VAQDNPQDNLAEKRQTLTASLRVVALLALERLAAAKTVFFAPVNSAIELLEKLPKPRGRRAIDDDDALAMMKGMIDEGEVATPYAAAEAVVDAHPELVSTMTGQSSVIDRLRRKFRASFGENVEEK